MAQQERKKIGGGKLSRSETVTVRLDPKLRYLAELAARKQRRTLSSFIEWSIEDTLSRIYLDDNGANLAVVASSLWDVDDADRFAKLAFRFPELLAHEEQVLWKLVKESGLMWFGSWNGNDNTFQWTVKEDNLRFEKLREHWDTFKKVAYSEIPKSELPKWNKHKNAADKGLAVNKEDESNSDDEIPF